VFATSCLCSFALCKVSFVFFLLVSCFYLCCFLCVLSLFVDGLTVVVVCVWPHWLSKVKLTKVKTKCRVTKLHKFCTWN